MIEPDYSFERIDHLIVTPDLLLANNCVD